MASFEDRGFGRIHIADPNDRKYPMRSILRPIGLPTARYYTTGPKLPLDQGNTGTCVAHAWTGFLLAALLMCKTAPNPFDSYRGIIAIDEFEDNDVEIHAKDADCQFGTSVRAGAQYFRTKGNLRNFVWAAGASEMAAWILSGQGTVVMGTNWYWGMSDLDKKGFARLEGGIAGGHAYLVIGYNRVTKAFRCLNSWGKEFGTKGRFWIAHDDMERLVREDGEACAATEQVVIPIAA